MNRQYNNELTPELLAAMDQSPFTAEQLAGMNDETRTLIAEKQAYCRLHPVNAIYRIAVDGSFTRESGTVRAAYNGNEIISTLCNGPMIVTRTGETMPEDFLFSTKVA